MKTSFGPQRLLFPMPTTLIVTGTIEKANIVTIAWVSLLTSSPPTLGISVGSKGFSGNEILNNGNFSVNIASVEIMTEADFCGITSGRTVDKFGRSGLTAMPSRYIDSPIIKECPVNLECKLVQSSMIGATNHFVGEILQVHIDTNKLKDTTDPRSFDIEAINPLIYIGGAREYRSIGKKVGDAYQVGKRMI
jgi:flavin reductase (DIM6/NTAB) family NADH-FMN oxidoreductase RutF